MEKNNKIGKLLCKKNCNGVFKFQNERIEKNYINYDKLFNNIICEYPSMQNLIKRIQDITPPQTKECNNLIELAQGGSKKARERIIYMYLRTVLKQAYSFSKAYDNDFEDMFQLGVIGLITAIEKYDTRKNSNFTTYFSFWVKNEMKRGAEVSSTVVHFPDYLKEKLFLIIDIKNKYKLCETEYIEYKDLKQEFVSKKMNNNIDSEELERLKMNLMPDLEYSEEVVGKSYVDASEEIINNYSYKYIVECLLKKLKYIENYVISKRFGLMGEKPVTIKEIGNNVCVTKGRIRQIEARGIKNMKDHLDKMEINLKELLDI